MASFVHQQKRKDKKAKSSFQSQLVKYNNFFIQYMFNKTLLF